MYDEGVMNIIYEGIGISLLDENWKLIDSNTKGDEKYIEYVKYIKKHKSEIKDEFNNCLEKATIKLCKDVKIKYETKYIPKITYFGISNDYSQKNPIEISFNNNHIKRYMQLILDPLVKELNSSKVFKQLELTFTREDYPTIYIYTKSYR